MRTTLVFILSALAVITLVIVGENVNHSPVTTVADYSVTDTELRHHTTADGRDYELPNDPAYSAGVCRDFGDGFTVCVPLSAPSGAFLAGPVEEDGSALYADGSTRDAETGRITR